MDSSTGILYTADVFDADDPTNPPSFSLVVMATDSAGNSATANLDVKY